MPLDAVVLSIAICLVFLTFAVVLAWADRTTSRFLRENSEQDSARVKKAA